LFRRQVRAADDFGGLLPVVLVEQQGHQIQRSQLIVLLEFNSGKEFEARVFKTQLVE
jgi:hypothetical protein